MAIEFVGSTKQNKGTTVNAAVNITLNSGLVGGIGSAVQAGDLVIIVNVSASAGAAATLTIKDPSAVSYTLVGSTLFANDTNGSNMLVGYKVMGSTPDASANFSQSTSVLYGGFAYAAVFRGVDPTNPLDVSAVTATAINTAIVDPPAITPITPGAVVVVAGMGGHTLGAVDFGITGLTNSRAENYNTTYDCSAGLGYVTWTSGALNPNAWTLTGGGALANSWVAITLALRPQLSGQIKTWSGSAWAAKPVKYWNGAAWVTKPLKRWSGSAWVITNY